MWKLLSLKGNEENLILLKWIMSDNEKQFFKMKIKLEVISLKIMVHHLGKLVKSRVWFWCWQFAISFNFISIRPPKSSLSIGEISVLAPSSVTAGSGLTELTAHPLTKRPCARSCSGNTSVPRTLSSRSSSNTSGMKDYYRSHLTVRARVI